MITEDNRNKFRRAFLGVVTSVLIVLVIFLAWRYVSITEEEQRNKAYEKEVSGVIDNIETRLAFMVETLYHVRGLLSLEEIDSQRWREYFLSAGIEDRYPDYFSFAQVDIVERSDLDKYIEAVKIEEKGNQEYQSFFVFPKTDNEQLYPIRLLHTFDSDIGLLYGYDVGSSASVSDAVAESMRTGGPSISSLTNLKLIIPSSDKTGYVIALPVYSSSSAFELPLEQRNRLLTKFIGAWVDGDKLFSDMVIAGDIDNTSLDFDVLDGEVVVKKGIDEVTERNYEKEIRLLNRKFRILFSGSEKMKLPFLQENLPLFTIIIGVIVMAMWYWTLISILTSRKRAEELANIATKDLKKFKMAVEGVSDHVIITDPEGVVIFANKAASRITGYSDKEILGQKPSLWGGQMPVSFYKKMWKVIKVDKKPFYGQLTNRRKSGDLYEAEVNLSPILNDKGDLIYFVGIERDITRAKSLDRMKTEFISLASHQLRTPLSAVKWFGRMLLAGDAGKLTTLQKEYLRKIITSNEREIQLVNSLLNISRIESGKIAIVPKQTNIEDLIKSVVSDVEISEGKKIRKIEVSVEEGIPLLNVDPDLIRHVYMNLLTNSIRYSGDGGLIKVTVGIKGSKLISEVKDEGIGIPAGEQGRIFERFFRAANAMKRETEGTGLGLYLVKTIVESSGGRIWFKSKEGKGTTFYFTLPLTGMKEKKGEVTLT